MSEIEKPLAHESCPKMLLYGIGVIGVRYVVWPKMAKVGILGKKNSKKLTFLENGLSEIKSRWHMSCPKMLLYGIGVIGVRYVVWPKMAKVGIFQAKILRIDFSRKRLE